MKASLPGRDEELNRLKEILISRDQEINRLNLTLSQIEGDCQQMFQDANRYSSRVNELERLLAEL